LEEKKKSKRRKLLYWLLLDGMVAVVVLVLLLYRPSQYHPLASALPPDPNGEPVPRYITHDLAPKLYNGAQSQRPFEMLVLDKRLNEAIARQKWPQESGGVVLSAPQVLFVPDRIVLMGTATIEGARFVLTIKLSPQLDEKGCLNLVVAKVKVGAMNVTPLARMMAAKMYKERLEMGAADTDDIRTQIAASLLNEEPFDPVFLIDDKWVRLKGFTLTSGQLVAQFVPAPPRR
jgi:hypothetical protein